jgi:hypothetical protein
MLFFYCILWRHSRSQCITCVMVDLVCIHFASVNASVPSPFPSEIYCDTITSFFVERYVTVDLSAEQCIACRLWALVSAYWCKLQNQIYCDVMRHSIQVMAARICKHYMQMKQINVYYDPLWRDIPRNWQRTNPFNSNRFQSLKWI